MPLTKAKHIMTGNPQIYEHQEKAFLDLFSTLAPHKHRYEVFKDFVTMSAISLHNGIRKDQGKENEYLALINGYERKDIDLFPKLLALLVQMLEHEPRDVLGSVMGALNLLSEDKGQFFTPASVSDLMAQMNYRDMKAKLEQSFITLSDPACGGGGLIFSFVKHMLSDGYNPAEKLWVSAIDIDRMTALTCYLQLSLWHIPAEVIVGNSLTMEIKEIWYTPAHHLHLWDMKLKKNDILDVCNPKEEEPAKPQTQTKAPAHEQSVPSPPQMAGDTLQQKPIQYDFGF